MQNALIILATRMLLKAPPNVGCQPLRKKDLLLGSSLTSSLPSPGPMIACYMCRSIRSTVVVATPHLIEINDIHMNCFKTSPTPLFWNFTANDKIFMSW